MQKSLMTVPGMVVSLPSLAGVTVLESHDAGADAWATLKSLLTSPRSMLLLGCGVALIVVLLIVRSLRKPPSPPSDTETERD